MDESTRTASRAVAEAVRSQREWELLQASVFGKKAVATFLQAVVSYVEAGGERRYLARLVDHFGTTPLAKIDQHAIDVAAKSLLPDAAPATVNRQIHTPLSAVLKHAAKRGLCDYRQVERPKQPRGRLRWLSPEDADRLIHACAPHLRPLVTFLFYSGARVGEALALEWEHVSLDRAHATFITTKNGTSRGVPLHPRVVGALSRLPNREGRVFRTPNGEPYAEKTDGGGQIKNAFRGACRRAGIADFTPHDCRHTWASWFYQEHRDLIGLMELGGWKSERMVLRYAHLNVSHLKQSIDALPWKNPGTLLRVADKT